MTLAKAKVRIAYWKRRLNLQEWTIRVKILPESQMEGTLGNITWSIEEARPIARMNLLDTADEDTLIHELLHLVIQGHKPYEKYDAHEERAINRIAAVLCNQN